MKMFKSKGLIAFSLFAGMAIPFAFFVSSFVLASFVENYSHFAQTVSELGRTGSPVEGAWRMTNILMACLFLLFANGVYRISLRAKLSKLPAIFIAYYGLTTFGYAIFAAPHPLHNVVGLAQILGYMSPLVLAIAWRKKRLVSNIVRWSWVCAGLVVVAMLLNLSPMFFSEIYHSGFYGLIQRSLFLVYHGAWCSLCAWKLYKLSLGFDFDN